MKKSSVTYEKPLPSIFKMVGELFISKGFDLAWPSGIAIDMKEEPNWFDSYTYGLGMLKKDPKMKPEKYFFGLFEKKVRRNFLGAFTFEEDEKKFIFLVYGRDNIKLAKQLADKIASMYKIKIVIRLDSVKTGIEYFHSDHSGT